MIRFSIRRRRRQCKRAGRARWSGKCIVRQRSCEMPSSIMRCIRDYVFMTWHVFYASTTLQSPPGDYSSSLLSYAELWKLCARPDGSSGQFHSALGFHRMTVLAGPFPGKCLSKISRIK